MITKLMNNMQCKPHGFPKRSSVPSFEYVTVCQTNIIMLENVKSHRIIY